MHGDERTTMHSIQQTVYRLRLVTVKVIVHPQARRTASTIYDAINQWVCYKFNFWHSISQSKKGGEGVRCSSPPSIIYLEEELLLLLTGYHYNIVLHRHLAKLQRLGHIVEL